MKKFIVPIIVMIIFAGVIVSVIGKNQESPGFIINAAFNKDDYQTIISANNQLGFDILPESEPNKDGNIFISPTSLLIPLSMAFNGADGITKEEMAKVLHKEGIEAEQLNKANASLMSMLLNDFKHSRLEIANSIWLNNQLHFQDEFAQNVPNYYNAKIQEVDVNSTKTPKIINNWVEKATNGRITKIVDEDINSNTAAFLINAIYFKGDWVHAFNPELTEKRTFHLGDGTTKELPLMTLHEKFAYMENEDFQAVILPYAGGKMSMYVFLPREGSSLEVFRKRLTNDHWEKWKAEFNKKDGTVLLPKFQLEYEAEWSKALVKLGMTTAFDDEKAVFTKMVKGTKGSVWIDKVKQKTFINVDEEGSEAAGATSVKMDTKAAPMDSPFQMEINRPFFITITNNDTGTILFMGSISKP
ncbi:serpin family protein [Neobacillus mesonae]|uniref:serpin family protein n=1 Tax=Neobacillus mesonae TaxID=1193713 RepID=UPI002E2400DA|nr:serpin family protein [Neobacillus mesonae]